MTAEQYSLVQTVLDRGGDGSGVDQTALAECVAEGWLIEGEDAYVLAIQGVDAMRPHQESTHTGDALIKLYNATYMAGRAKA